MEGRNEDEWDGRFESLEKDKEKVARYYQKQLDNDPLLREAAEYGKGWKNNPKNCKFCHGTNIKKTCTWCNKGVVHCDRCRGKGKNSYGETCTTCRGTGIVKCSECNGKYTNVRCSHTIY